MVELNKVAVMIVLEFRKEDHEKNMNLLHRIKTDICELYKNLEESEMSSAHGERRYEIEAYDERRGGSHMGRRDMMDERRGRMSYRDNRMSMDRHYPEYPIEERGGGRYNY